MIRQEAVHKQTLALMAVVAYPCIRQTYRVARKLGRAVPWRSRRHDERQRQPRRVLLRKNSLRRAKSLAGRNLELRQIARKERVNQTRLAHVSISRPLEPSSEIVSPKGVFTTEIRSLVSVRASRGALSAPGPRLALPGGPAGCAMILGGHPLEQWRNCASRLSNS